MSTKINECVDNLCVFHMKTGESIIGYAMDISHNKVTIKRNEIRYRNNDTRIKLDEKLLHTIIISSNGQWGNLPLRSQMANDHILTFNGKHTIKKLIIFGAGASYDIGLSRNCPLTNELFQNPIIDQFPGAKLLRPKINSFIAAGGTLEDFFQEKWEEIFNTGDVELLARLINTQYFIQEQFRQNASMNDNDDVTNYMLLIEYIRRYLKNDSTEKIPIVTFNYDTLLEKALCNIYDWKYSKIEDYIYNDSAGLHEKKLKPIMLFKPHGSWNWVYRLNNIFASEGFSNQPKYIYHLAKEYYNHKVDYAQLKFAIYPELKQSDILLQDLSSLIKNNFKIIEFNDSLDYEFYPNLLIPFKSKDEVLMPLLHQNMLHNLLQDVTEVLVIGWKGTEDKFNETFLQAGINSREVKLYYVSPNSDSVENELLKYIKILPIRFKGSFSDYLREIRNKPDSEYNFFRHIH